MGRARGGRLSGKAILYFARHGETDWNAAGRWQGQTDIPLNDVGRAQARALAERLRGEGIVAVGSSDLSRARATAEIVAAALGLSVTYVDPALRERAYGVFEGLTLAECEERFPAEWARFADPGGAPAGGETLDALAARMRSAASSAAARKATPALHRQRGGLPVRGRARRARPRDRARRALIAPPLCRSRGRGAPRARQRVRGSLARASYPREERHPAPWHAARFVDRMALRHDLRHRFAPLLIAPLGLAAALSVEGIEQLAGVSLAANEVRFSLLSSRSAQSAPPAGPPPFHSTSAAAILARNPFDSQPRPQEAAAATSDGAPPCDDVRVLAIAASSDSEWSFAALAVGKEPRAVLRRRGGEVGKMTVSFIAWDRVWLSDDARLCQVPMFAPARPVADGTAPTQTTVPGLVNPAILGGIQRVNATERNIDRATLDRILEAQAELLASVHAAPQMDHGKVVGVNLLGIRPGSMLDVLGLANGDRLQAINGFDMSNPSAALEAYGRLRQADHLIVSVNRGGKNVNLDYFIK